MSNERLKIIVVGMGNIGKRHIESIAKLPYLVDLYIVDLEIKHCKNNAFLANLKLNNNLKIYTYTGINELEENVDLAIIATNSLPRLQLLKETLANCKVKFLILEKFLFPFINEYHEAKEFIFGNESNIYVNCGRRAWDSYKELKEVFKGDKKLSIEVVGGNWNLASNAIHFLDLFHYFLDFDEIQVEIVEESIKFIESKRAGYINYFGEIVASDNMNNILSLKSLENLEPGIQYIKLVSEKNECIIFERKGSYILNDEYREFTLENVSDLTSKIISDLLLKKQCNLIDIHQSMGLHLALLSALNKSQKLKEGILT